MLTQDQKYSLFKSLPEGTEMKMRSHYSVLVKDQIVLKVSMKNNEFALGPNAVGPIVVCRDANGCLCDIPYIMLTCEALEVADQL